MYISKPNRNLAKLLPPQMEGLLLSLFAQTADPSVSNANVLHDAVLSIFTWEYVYTSGTSPIRLVNSDREAMLLHLVPGKHA